MKKKRAPKVTVWKYTVGETPRLTAFERSDRDGAIWTRIGPDERGRYSDQKPLCDSIRREDGRIDEVLEARAKLAASDRQRELAAGVTPTATTGKLRLKRAIQIVLHPKTGKYVAASEWKADVTRHLETAVRVLGDIPVEEIKHSHYRKLWLTLAEEHMADSARYGARATEMIVGSLRSAMSWLAQQEYIPPFTALPAPRWKSQMQDEWVKKTGKPISPPDKPRYSKGESALIWLALPKADPRIALATEIGAELRLGQVVERTRRSEVEPHREHEIGLLRVHGSGKKKGVELVLTDSQRGALVEAMTTGFLSDVEAEYRAGRLDDYLLISGGYLAGGKAQPKNAMKPMGKRAMRTYWRELEKLAGVEHVEGRGWYGLRRRFADDAEDESDDQRVLNKMGGWTDSKTRQRYQEEGRKDIAEEAAKVRAKIRPGKRTESAEITPTNSTSETIEK